MSRFFLRKPLDILSILVSLLAITGVTLFAYGGRPEPSQVSIETDQGAFLYPLSENRTLEFDGPLGVTHVLISQNSVRVTESPCRDKICIAAGHLDTTGQWTACLPNRVFVVVEGAQDEDEVDAQTF
ncbi:MAG: NusG domain II-containing protein [Spirochaetales bacterium]